MLDKRFERLTVIGEAGQDKWNQCLWECQCDCGNIIITTGYGLRSGRTKSCGCLKIDLLNERSRIHGMTGTATYSSWAQMVQRCNNPKATNYQDYGGRGIRIEDSRWLKFENFFADMGIKPEGLTLERKNNGLGYSKKNCVWADRTTQARNQRTYKNNKTGAKGVFWHKRDKKYAAYIQADHKMIYLGYFATIPAAAVARKQAEQKYWGEDIANL